MPHIAGEACRFRVRIGPHKAMWDCRIPSTSGYRPVLGSKPVNVGFAFSPEMCYPKNQEPRSLSQSLAPPFPLLPFLRD